MIDWNRNGIYDPVDVGIDIAVQSANSEQEIYIEKNFSDPINKSPLFSLFREIEYLFQKRNNKREKQ